MLACKKISPKKNRLDLGFRGFDGLHGEGDGGEEVRRGVCFSSIIGRVRVDGLDSRGDGGDKIEGGAWSIIGVTGVGGQE